MCQLSAGDAARRHRPALRGAAAETEQRPEERDAARRRDAGPPLARRRNLLLALALLRRLDHAALTLDRRERAAVDIVDVAAGLQLSGVIDERVLISQQDPDLRRQLNVLLAGAEHPLTLSAVQFSFGRAMLKRTSAYLAGSCTRMQPWL